MKGYKELKKNKNSYSHLALNMNVYIEPRSYNLGIAIL
jgi:hypothetical protein